MKYSDLFIDFDDTLYDTHGNAVIALKELYDELGLDSHIGSEDEFYRLYWEANRALWAQYSNGEITRDYLIYERFRRPLSSAAKDDAAWVTREYCLQVSDRFLELCSVKPGLISGAEELVKALKDAGYRMHICSNGFHEVQYKKLQACRLYQYFDSIILSEDAGSNKPSREFFDYALKTTGACRESTLMIGDNYKTDILGAMDAGLDTMLFNIWNVRDLPRKPTYTIDSLKTAIEILVRQ